MEPLIEIQPHLPEGEAGEPAVPGHEVLRPLGRGGAGSVWLVREMRSGRLLAAKVLGPGAEAGESPGDPGEALALARRELRLSTSHEHEHILPLRGVVAAEGNATGAPVLLSDYAAGGSLGQLVGVRGGLGVGECVTVVTPIAQALAALHADGAAHGDVSPGNILFTAHGKPLLSDFGLGRMLGDRRDGRGGTPGFRNEAAAPGGRSADPAGDVFSLGAVAWFALTGEPPQPTAQRPPLSLLVEGVPAELAAAVEAALRDDPRERPSAAELARAVFRSARAERVDLAPAADASVLPELLTRLAPDTSRGERRRGRPGRGGRGRLARRRLRAPFRLGGRARLWSLWGVAAVLFAATLVAGGWWAVSLGRPEAGAGVGGAAVGSSQGESGHAWAALPQQLRRGAESGDPVQAVQALSEIRARAIGARDRALIDTVNAEGSAAAAADTALLERLEAAGQRLEGFSARVLSAARDAAPAPFSQSSSAPAPSAGGPSAAGAGSAGGAETAVVRVRIVTSGYTVRDAAGTTVGEHAAGADQDLRIVLERVAGGLWKVARILDA